MVQVLNKRWAGPFIYCLGVLGGSFFIALLAPLVLVHTIVLARPYFEGSPPSPLSLIQRRQMDAALSQPPSPNQAAPLIPTEVPREPLGLYAAELDIAESQEPQRPPAVAAFELESEPSSVATERKKLRVAHAETGSRDMSARDIFNRSFGVLTAAAN
jgi:hypothetical protein